MRSDITGKLRKFYREEIPDYILDAGKSFIRIRTADDVHGKRDVKITVKDVACYYAHDARNISSGCRTLAGITGDWRPIDTLAHECLEWLKFVNKEGLRREAESWDWTRSFKVTGHHVRREREITHGGNFDRR
jgi:hypothetical protein